MVKSLSIKNYSSGMSLLEMVILIGIYTLLLLAITSSIAEIYKYNSYAISQANEIENARNGMTRWSKDVREMTDGEDGTFPLAVIEEHRIGYYSDTDQDLSVEYVEYILASTTLTKYTYNATGSPAVYSTTTPDLTETISLYVQNINEATSTFQYFDNAGTLLSSTSPIIDVRYIKAQFIVNIDSVRSPGEFMLRSSVAPRNLKDNL